MMWGTYTWNIPIAKCIKQLNNDAFAWVMSLLFWGLCVVVGVAVIVVSPRDEGLTPL